MCYALGLVHTNHDHPFLSARRTQHHQVGSALPSTLSVRQILCRSPELAGINLYALGFFLECGDGMRG